MFALLLLPVCFWAYSTLHRRARPELWISAVAATAALVLSHNSIAFAGGLMLLAYWLTLAIGYRNPAGLFRCAAADAVAATLSAGFWLPALADLPPVESENAQLGVNKLGELFLHWWQVTGVQSPILDSRAGNPLRPINTFGAAAWLSLIVGLTSVPFTIERDRKVWAFLGAAFALAMLMCATPATRVAWENLPGLSLFLFPSRFLSIAPLGTLPAAALMIDAWRKRRWIPGLVLVSTASLVIFPFLFPRHTPMFFRFEPVEELDSLQMQAYECAANAWGMTSYNEFLVRGTD